MNRKFFSLIFSCLSIILFYGCDPTIDSCWLSDKDALKKLDQINQLLNDKSPYMQIHQSRVQNSIDEFKNNLAESESKGIDKRDFTFGLQSILGQLGDRHAWVFLEGKCNEDTEYYLPFALAPWNNATAVALKQLPKLKYDFLLEDYPFLTKINGKDLSTFLKELQPRNTYAPKMAKHSQGIDAMNEFYQIKPGLSTDKILNFTFSGWDFKADTTISMQLDDNKIKWREINSYYFYDSDSDKNDERLFKQFQNQIAYIKIPDMISADRTGYYDWLREKMRKVASSKALIIDLRNNPGGNRDLIRFFSNYLLAPDQHLVANVARYRGKVNRDSRQDLHSRNLYSYDEFEDEEIRKTIDQFRSDFHPTTNINKELYSERFYMVLLNEDKPGTYYYDKPVYILTNEFTFSAASVFVGSFKGINKIKIAGTTTDGASGLSKNYSLGDSGIHLNLSHMLSFQKDGTLFDGQGTIPDIRIERTMPHVFGHKDSQLEALLNHIIPTDTSQIIADDN